MSLRAALVKAVGLVRRRVLATGKHHPTARPHDQSLTHQPSKTWQKAFVECQAGKGESLAAQLRRNAALRLIESRNVSSRTRLGGWGGKNLAGYALVGLTLAAGERGLLVGGDEDAVEGNGKMRRLPLDTCCEIVRDIFGSHESGPDRQQTEDNFPSYISSYDISKRLLGKGTSASIYAARLKQSLPTEGLVPEAMFVNEEDVHEDEVDGVHDEEEEDWEMVSNEETGGQESADVEGDASFVEVSLLESLDAASDADKGSVEEEMEGSSQGHPSKEDGEDSYNLALKMMFNYDVASNAVAISQAFEREYLPLWPAFGKGSFGDVQWENGHRAKKKDRRFLPSHPNIVEVYHAFVAPTTTHDLEEARTLFPAALPTRLHFDGFGRNQTMFLVMKRYDMTLDEYNHAIGCPSQHAAMVIMAQLLEGVSHLVDYGIAHRDLKTNNILVELTAGSPRVVIADFGCCLADDTVGLHLPYPTKYAEIGGNSALMAPEVKSSVPGPHTSIAYTKSDAWAVGTIGYEIMGLPNPFYRHSDGRPGLDSALYEEDDLPGLPDNTHPGLAKVISLLLMKDPDMRPTSKVAANMLHLSLWQPPVFTFASWEGSELIPAQISIQQHLTTWLLRMSAGLLCQRSTVGQKAGVKGRKAWLDATEYRLCVTLMSRLTQNDLLRAANHLVS